jgi:hypothetical protein
MDLASPSPPPEVIAPPLPPLSITPLSTKVLNVLNPATDGPTSLDSSACHGMALNHAVTKDNDVDDNGGDSDASSAILDDATPPPCDLVETRENAPPSVQMKKFEEMLEKLQVYLTTFRDVSVSGTNERILARRF